MRKRNAIVGSATALAALGILGPSLVNAHAAAKTTITIGYAKSSDASNQTLPNWLSNVAKQFQAKHPGVNVKLIPIESQDYYTKVDLMERSPRTSPDIVYEDSFMIGPDAQAGYLQPINSVKSWSDWKQFYPAMQSIVQSNGNVYGVMIGTDVQAMYYSVSLFKKAGLPVPWQPKNWNDVIKAAQAIHKAGSTSVPLWLFTGSPLAEASSFRGFEVFLWGTHDQLYDYATKKWVISGPGFDETWKFLQKVHNLGLEEPEADWSNPNGWSVLELQLIPQQKVGIAVDGSWIGGNYVSTGSHPDPSVLKNYLVAELPTADGQAPGYTNQSGGWALSVTKYSPNPKLALEYIEQATSKQNLANFDAAGGGTPPRGDVAKSATMQKAISQNPFLKATLPFVAYTHYRPSVGTAYTQVSNEIAKLTGEISMGTSDAKKVEQEYATAVTQAAGANNVEKANK